MNPPPHPPPPPPPAPNPQVVDSLVGKERLAKFDVILAGGVD